MILIAKGKFDRWRTPEGLTLLQGWARDGKTDEELAKAMGIVPSTLYVWKERFPEISEALKKGKDVIDTEVENALLRRALGYAYTETRKETGADGKTEKIITVTKHVAPDVTAQIFWLKNRRPDKYRNRIKDDLDSGKTDFSALDEAFEAMRSETDNVRG